MKGKLIAGVGVISLVMAVLLNIPASSTANTGSMDGISRLVSVAQLKASNANDEAQEGATKQRELVRQQKEVRSRDRETEVLRQLEANAKHTADILKTIRLLEAEVKKTDCK